MRRSSLSDLSKRPLARASRATGTVIEQLERRWLFALDGAVYVTDNLGAVMNGNIFMDINVSAGKKDVYLNSGRSHDPNNNADLPAGDYYVRVTDPSGKTVLGSSSTADFHVSGDGSPGRTQLWGLVQTLGRNPQQGYSDTSNGGGEYKVWVSTDSSFPRDNSRFDHFKITPPRGLHGHKFHDHNGNGQQDSEDEDLPGVQIFLDDNNNGMLDAADLNGNGVWDSGEGEMWTITSTYGEYSLVPPAAGTYRTREISPPGWDKLSDNPADVSLGRSDIKKGGNHGNFRHGCAGGHIFNDRNDNGMQDDGEEALGGPGWSLRFDGNDFKGNGVHMSVAADASGNYDFNDIPRGNGNGYTISIVPPAGWVQTTSMSSYSVQNMRSGECRHGHDFGFRRDGQGRMNGGGFIFNNGVKISHGMELHSDFSRKSNLEVNYGQPDNHFHLSSLTMLHVLDMVRDANNQFDAVKGSGIGRGVIGGQAYDNLNISFLFTNSGKAKYKITDASNNVLLDTGDPKDMGGGHQMFRPEPGTVSKTAAQIGQQVAVDLGQLDNSNLSPDQVTTLTNQLLYWQDQYEIALLAG